MEYDWDPGKAAANLRKHSINFAAVGAVFNDPAVVDIDVTRPQHGEKRRKAIGRLPSGWVVAVIYTDRGDVRRIISVPRARRGERATYDSSQKLTGRHDGRGPA